MNKQDVSIFAALAYGYKVSYEDILDAKERIASGFADVADDGSFVTIGIEQFQTCSLVRRIDSRAGYDKQSLYIGVILDTSFDIQAVDMEYVTMSMWHYYDTVKAMYTFVMHREPMEEPKMLLTANTAWWN